MAADVDITNIDDVEITRGVALDEEPHFSAALASRTSMSFVTAEVRFTAFLILESWLRLSG